MGNVSGKREEAESSRSFKIEDEDEDEDEEYMECTHSTGGDYHMQHALYPEFTQQRTDSCERIMGKNKNKRGGRGRIQHYDWKQKILLVGEGDFSFSACLAKAFGSANNLVATCLHSQEMLQEKHWTSVREVQAIETRGGLVFYEVDVSIMNRHPDLKGYKFDIIIFNFPHAGHLSWLCERDQELIRKHKKLIKAYFRSAKEMLEEAGEIHITLRQDPPYDSWEVEEIARKVGLHLKEKVEFIQANYPGYHNKRGSNIDCNKKFPLTCCYTFKFILPKPKGGSVESVLTTLQKLQI